MTDTLTIAGRAFTSRLFLGTGKYPNNDTLLAALKASGTEMVTLAIRRMNLAGEDAPLIEKLAGYHFLPNTAGCYTVEEAVLTAELAREALDTNWIKLEVIGDKELLYPDVEGTVAATRILVDKGFVVLPYCNEDPVTCRKLADAGAAAVMPLGSPIGSGPRHQEPGADRGDLRPLAGAGDPGRRPRHRVGRRPGDGARLRRGAAQHRRRQGRRPGEDGGGDEGGGGGRAARPARRPHPAAVPGQSVEPDRGPGRGVMERGSTHLHWSWPHVVAASTS